MPKLTETQKAKVHTWINQWAVKLTVARFHIDIKFHNKKDPTTEGDSTVFADVGHHYAGLEADINIWSPFWRLSEQQQERVCVHELVHILLPSATEEEICSVTEIIWCLAKGSANAAYDIPAPEGSVQAP